MQLPQHQNQVQASHTLYLTLDLVGISETRRHIDRLVIALEAKPHPIRRVRLHLQKRWYERRIPAVRPITEQGGQS